MSHEMVSLLCDVFSVYGSVMGRSCRTMEFLLRREGENNLIDWMGKKIAMTVSVALLSSPL